MRRHIGFERLWSMQIPVPYSLMVRDGEFGWSCGQCPLDRSGHVVAPNDPAAQTALVADYAATLLSEMDFQPADLRMAVIYHDAPDPAPVLDILRRRLGPALFVPVRVPQFYYAGMRIEVDLFAMAAPATLAFSAGTADPSQTPLLQHWVGPLAADLPPQAIIDSTLAAPFAWTISAPDVTSRSHMHAGTTVTIRRSGPFCALSAIAPQVQGLVPQTEALMQAFASALAAEGLGFADVVKSTTHYVGAPTAQELHDNMEVRNRRYRSPGPASTGIPVAALAHPDARTAITLLTCKNGRGPFVAASP